MNTDYRHRAAAPVLAMLLDAMILTAPTWAGASESSLPNTTAIDVRISLENVRFTPREITVAVGNTVTWTHRDSGLSHHVAAHDGSFDSHPTCGRPFGACMKGGDTFSHTFLQGPTSTTAGCTRHPTRAWSEWSPWSAESKRAASTQACRESSPGYPSQPTPSWLPSKR